MAGVLHVTPDVAKAEYSDDESTKREGLLEMDQEEVDAIIRNKRKVRDPKACYACHRRKVKCDRNLPCDSCVKRDHPELCSYERPTKKRRIALSNALAAADGAGTAVEPTTERIINSGPNLTVPKEQWERLHRELAELRAHVREEKDGGDGASVHMSDEPYQSANASGVLSLSDEGDREGVHAPSSQMGTMHLGSRSVLAYMIGNRSKSTQDAARQVLKENILPNLGLDNESTTYPFVDLWSTDKSMQDVSGLMKTLPNDDVCREFWLTYKDIPCTIYPVVPDVEAFDQTLSTLLQTRAEFMRTGKAIDPNRPYGLSLPWIALLFAVLASGIQCTGRAAKERELTSQVYICCAYQALRMSNFLTHPSLETIQALLIVGNALSYNMNPGVSYVLLGMTLRSALSMGLHVRSQNFSEHENYLRSRIWWALAWQDAHFSVSYDRPSSSILCMTDVPYTKHSSPGNRSYVESMSEIIKLTQGILRYRALNQQKAMNWSMIAKYKDDVHKIWDDALPRLRNRAQCVLLTDHLERLALRLHCSYLISEICRPALKEDPHPPTSDPTNTTKSPVVSPGNAPRKSSYSSAHSSNGDSPQDQAIVLSLRAECVKHLENVVGTYVELNPINKYAARSWIGIQRSISAAFLLGVLPETKQEPRVIRLLTELERGIQESAIEDTDSHKSQPDSITPMGPDGRRLSMSVGHSRDAPLWVRSMTGSLSALSKLNAALAGKASSTQFPTSHAHHPHQQQHWSINAAATAAAGGVYNTPVVSPGGHTPGINGVMMGGMPQFPVLYPPNYQSNFMVQQVMPTAPAIITGPYTPESQGSNGDWNAGNLSERALKYVHPGLWGGE